MVTLFSLLTENEAVVLAGGAWLVRVRVYSPSARSKIRLSEAELHRGTK